MDRDTLSKIRSSEQEEETRLLKAREKAGAIIEEARKTSDFLLRQGTEKGREEGESESRKTLETAAEQVREINTRSRSEIEAIRKSIGDRVEAAAKEIFLAILRD